MIRKDPADHASDEAAAWHARLNNRSVSTAELEEFYRWRRDPANAAAYGETERAWRLSRSLSADSDIAGAVDEVLGRPVMSRPWWRRWRLQVGLAGSALLAMLAAIWMVTRPLVFETGIGEQRLVRLADGSLVHLDTRSRVEVRLRGAGRDVTLTRGQVYFEVAKDARRPFVVTTDGATVRALGTDFSVRAEGDTVAVALAEGSVRVSGTTAGNAVLRPGQMVTLAGGRAGVPRAADLQALTSWTTGHLIFRNTALATAVAEINRYSTAPIVLDDARAASVHVNGVFDADNTDAFAAAASAVSGLRARRLSDGSIRLGD